MQIFSRLDPLDVLRLAQTTKALREVLMRRSARFIWKKALTNVDLPQCPSDMTEPEYTRLAYDSHCYVSSLLQSIVESSLTISSQYCNAQRIQLILWVFRKRCCKKCTAEK